MSAKKFGFGSLCLIIVSATSTSLMSQVGIAATSQSPSYKPSQQIFCGCPQPPVWEENTKSSYRPPIYCPDSSPFARTIKRTCPDFYRTFQGSTTNPKSSILAYDPDAKEAARIEKEAAHGHSPKEILDAVSKGIDTGNVLGGMAAGAAVGGRLLGGAGVVGGAATGGAAAGIHGAVQSGYNYCKSCHKEWP
ncbi:hypothetical protein NIES2111_67700 (plasmid) [Nostoc sp. NIES-2111]|nr:hypothetical protein NIES2111_67700 [Nostoc sp. NIES-2111]